MKNAPSIQDIHFCNWDFFIFTIKLFQTIFFFSAVIWILISQGTDDAFISFRAENKID